MMKSRLIASLVLAIWLGNAMALTGLTDAESATRSQGAIEIPSFVLPCSSLASEEACRAIAAEQTKSASRKEVHKPAVDQSTESNIAAARNEADEEIILPLLRKQEARWGGAVGITPKIIKGVYTELFEPKEGVSVANRHRLLLNLHGGGFMVGGRTHGRLESLPIAGLGKIRVISIDYRMAPEYLFPAASEDVATVYSELLKRYKPKRIGIFGCSAGGMLTAEAVGWLIKQNIPLPGAIGMFGNTGLSPFRGDSANIPTAGPAPGDLRLSTHPYFRNISSEEDPLITPIQFPDVLKRFPPSLLIGGTRGPQLSSILYAANRLTLAGVSVQLNVWDGVGECQLDADLPEAHEAERIIIDFFNKYLMQ
jgi:monoterpene epsilon-lactone hydrolase